MRELDFSHLAKERMYGKRTISAANEYRMQLNAYYKANNINAEVELIDDWGNPDEEIKIPKHPSSAMANKITESPIKKSMSSVVNTQFKAMQKQSTVVSAKGSLKNSAQSAARSKESKSDGNQNSG